MVIYKLIKELSLDGVAFFDYGDGRLRAETIIDSNVVSVIIENRNKAVRTNIVQSENID